MIATPLVQVAGPAEQVGLQAQAFAQAAPQAKQPKGPTIAQTNPISYKLLEIKPGKLGRSELESGELATVSWPERLYKQIDFSGVTWRPSPTSLSFSPGGVKRYQVSVWAPEIGVLATVYDREVLSGNESVYKWNPQKFLDDQSQIHELDFDMRFTDGSVQEKVVLPLRLLGLDGRLANDPDGDFDGDGVSNSEEAKSGANPFDARDKGVAKKPLPKLPETTTPTPTPTTSAQPKPQPSSSQPTSAQPKPSTTQPKPSPTSTKPTSTQPKPQSRPTFMAEKYDPYPGELLVRLTPGEEYRSGTPFGSAEVPVRSIRYRGEQGGKKSPALDRALVDATDGNRFVVKAKGLEAFAQAYEREFGNSKPEFERAAKWFMDTFVTHARVEVEYPDNSADAKDFLVGFFGVDERAFSIPTADFDGDGVNNEDEVRLGTNPFSADSKPHEKPRFPITSKSLKPGEVYEFVPSTKLDPNTKFLGAEGLQVSLTKDGNVRVVGSRDRSKREVSFQVWDPLYKELATLYVESDFSDAWSTINVQAGTTFETNVMTQDEVKSGLEIVSTREELERNGVPEWVAIGGDGVVFLNPPRSEGATKGARRYWVRLSNGEERVIKVNVLAPASYAELYSLQYSDVFVRLGHKARSHAPLATVVHGASEFLNQPIPDEAQVSYEIVEGEGASVVAHEGTATDDEQPGMVTFDATNGGLKAGDVVKVVVRASFADESAQEVPVYFNILPHELAGSYEHAYETGRAVLPGRPIVLHRTDIRNVPEGTEFLFFEDVRGNENLAGWQVSVNRDTGNLVVRAPENGARPLDAVVTVAYPDGSSTEVPFHVGVKHGTPDAETFAPKYTQETLIGGTRTSYEMLTPVPKGTSFSIEENAGLDVGVDTQTGRITAVLPEGAPGGATYKVRVRVKYPDGSDEFIDAQLRKKATADDERPRWSDIYVLPGELASTPQARRIPPETTFGIDATFAARGWQVHVDKYSGRLQVLPDASVKPNTKIEVPVVVTFKDGSQRTVKVPAYVRTPRQPSTPTPKETTTPTPSPSTSTPTPIPEPDPAPETGSSAAGWITVILGALGFLVGAGLLALQEIPVVQSNLNHLMRDLGLRR
ncbi:hypothetical protein BJP07_08495 [Corynebacterium sp. NML130628]|nr:hypothetical protein BJP07_08495 [Corynebacterium sp. NML130628]